MKTIKDRAIETVQKRLRGSFGYRAAESVVNGYDPTENLAIYKSHDGTSEELDRLLTLSIERGKPQTTAKEAAAELGIDIGEAQAMLDEGKEQYDEVVKNRAEFLKELTEAFKKAPKVPKEISTFNADNYNRVLDNLVRDARKQFMRSKNAEWANAVNEAVTPVQAAVIKLTKQQAA
jgi:hypothetical protein